MPSYSQSTLVFELYNSGPVTYAMTDVPAGLAGQPVDTTFQAAVYCGSGMGFTSVSDLIYAGPLVFSSVVPGHYSGSVVLPFSPGAQITLAVVAWETTGPYGEVSYNFDPAIPVIQGASALWIETVSSTQPWILPVDRPTAFTVQIVPEPSSIVLVILGWVILHRR